MPAGDLLATLLAGGVFGLALAAPPGPMNAIIAEESVLRGWVAGFRAGLGAMTADACFLALSLAGFVAALESLPRLRGAMVLVGGTLMWYFAVDAARNARATFAPAGGDPAGASDDPIGAGDDPAGRAADGDGSPDAGGPGTGPGKGFRKALVLALTNPYQILFWLTVGVGLLEPGRLDALARTPYVGPELAGVLVVHTGTPALVVGLFAGILAWIVGFPAALVAGRRRVEALAPLVAGLSALALVGFGTLFLADGLGALL